MTATDDRVAKLPRWAQDRPPGPAPRAGRRTPAAATAGPKELTPMPAPAQRTASAPTYPIPRPYRTDDRFTVALVQDVANVLAGHGYPGITHIDLVRLTLALSEFIYAEES